MNISCLINHQNLHQQHKTKSVGQVVEPLLNSLLDYFPDKLSQQRFGKTNPAAFKLNNDQNTISSPNLRQQRLSFQKLHINTKLNFPEASYKTPLSANSPTTNSILDSSTSSISPLENSFSLKKLVAPPSPVSSISNHEDSANDLTNDDEYPFTCTSCPKKFRKLVHLKSHRRIHDIKKPFKCNECNQTFLRKHDLRRHEKIHEGVKPYVCKRCGRAFARKDGLRRHEAMEPLVRKFRCNDRSDASIH